MGLLNRAAMMHQQQQQQQAALYPASNSLYSPSMPSEQLPQQQAAPSPAPPQLRISSLNDLWSLLDYNPSTGQITSSSLDMNSFQARLYEKLQDPVVMSALFSNYKNQIG